jgi:hypothetical protein
MTCRDFYNSLKRMTWEEFKNWVMLAFMFTLFALALGLLGCYLLGPGLLLISLIVFLW